mmetsp:Transcript_57198/g.107293  ORF Transcript_57198/g.107293 Transcript_57198/m.107293 type:complete len:193 (-) Transcript_57198:136-714(-)
MMAAVEGNNNANRAERGEMPVVQGIPVGDPQPGIVGAPHMHAPAPLYVLPGGMTPEEILVLNYRVAVMCFATIDLLTTVLNVITALSLDRRWTSWELVLLIYLLGPVCGLIGAKRLNRTLITVYLISCFAKCVTQISLAIYTVWLWHILFAFVQVWVTKIVATFWYCLGMIPYQRRASLLDIKDVEVRMVYW